MVDLVRGTVSVATLLNSLTEALRASCATVLRSASVATDTVYRHNEIVWIV